MRIIKYTISILLFVLAGIPAAASQYGDMQRESKTHTPAFYQQSLESARNQSGHVESFSPDGEQTEKAFDQAFSDMEKVAKKKTNVNVEKETLHFLSPEAQAEYRRINTLVKSGKAKHIFGETITQDSLLAAAAVFSPAVKSAEKDLSAAMNRYGQSVYLDQLLLQYLDFTESLDTKTSSNQNRQMVQMNYPFPGMTTLKGNAVDKDVEIERVEFEKAVRDTLADVKTKYADVLYFDSVLNITCQNLGLARDIDRVALKLYETGSADYSNMVKISIRVDKLGAMADTFAWKKDAAVASLRDITGLPHETVMNKFRETKLSDAPELPELKSIRNQALTRSQELRSMQLMVERMDIMIEMGGRKLFPDYSLGLSNFQNNEVMSVGAQGQAPAFMNRPMGAGAPTEYASENAYLMELKDKKNSLVQKLADMRNRTTSMVETVYANFSSSKNNAYTYEKKIIRKAQNSYEATLGAYTSGSGSFIDLLDAHRVLLDHELAYQDALLMARTSFAILEKTAGGRINAEKGEAPHEN